MTKLLPMKIKIKRFDPEIPLPSYQTKGAACVDLYARLETTIASHQIGYIPLNIALEVPEGYWVMVVARSSTHKTGLMPAHGIGIGDWDFRGDDDEYHFPVYNFTDNSVTITKGQRIAQLMILKYDLIQFEEVSALSDENRGKFGSTE